eukprot:1142829-Pelagomonas_calceolata.AAC.2
MGQDLKSMLDTFDFEAAVAAHTYVPVASRDDMKLRELFKKVDDIELGMLCDGIDEGEEPDFDFANENGEEEEDVGAWMSEEEQEAYGDDGKDCFGVDLENERDSGMDKGADCEARAAAELDGLQLGAPAVAAPASKELYALC